MPETKSVDRRKTITLPHLAPAAIAVLAIGAALLGVDLYARTIERQSIHALATEMFEQKNFGSALQKEAFRNSDLLPVYGSSELIFQTEYEQPFHARRLFEKYPTGFNIFSIGAKATSPLIVLQKLAAVGSELKGRKVVISLSTPALFFDIRKVEPDSYAGNFSPLQAGELIFSTDLSLPLKQLAAQRMLAYP